MVTETLAGIIQVFRDVDENPGDETFPGVVVCGSPAACSSRRARHSRTASALSRRMGRRRCAPSSSTSRASYFIDSQGAAQLAAILELVHGNGATLRLAPVKPIVLAVLRADSFVDRLGADQIHGNVYRAVEAQLHA